MRHPAAPRLFGARLPPPDRRASRLCAGSGSTYIYGFCDAYYRPGMNQQQCEEFVTKALCHAMARDGSSGGVIRTVRIDESGVERKMIAGNKLPYGPL